MSDWRPAVRRATSLQCPVQILRRCCYYRAMLVFWRLLALVIVSLVSLVALGPPASAQLVGRASVIDGDTIEIQGQRIRVFGIDAPEGAQVCTRAGKQYRCGEQAATALADKLGERTVSCEQRDVDQYGRIVAVCRVAGEDINGWLAEQGWALAYREFSKDYVDEEAAAKAARRGLWQGTFVAPWLWRQDAGPQPPRAAVNDNAPATPPGKCTIKGNVSDRGERIYHVPGGQFYEATVISPTKGERWFCSEADARTAGWRKSLR